MNPLSAWTFNRRHKRRTGLLLSLIILMTAGLYIMGAVLWGVFIEPARMSYMALSKFSLVTPALSENNPNLTVISQIRANPDIARIIPISSLTIDLSSMIPNESIEFKLFGLNREDLTYVLGKFNATLKEGQMLSPGTNGLLLSEEIAKILGVRVGDTYEMLSKEVYGYSRIPNEATTMEVVGVLKSDVRLGIVSLEFLNHHELYREFPARYLIAAQENRASAADDFLRNEIQSAETDVQTLKMLNDQIMNEAIPALALLIPPVFIVTAAFTQVVVIVTRIANMRRLPEFGILHATGHSKKWLFRRLTAETATMTSVGWVLGVALAWLALSILNATLLVPRGRYLSFIAWMPFVLVIPIPVTVIGFAAVSVRRTFARLDPVTIIERGEMSQRREQKRARTISKSSSKPLAPTTYYKRHKRQIWLVISMMGLTIFAVTLIVFILGVSADAQEPFQGYLRKVSFVRSPGIIQDLDPGIVAQIETLSSVARIIPVAPRFHMVNAWVPPFESGEVSPFAVYAEDMAYLVELYGLELKEGHLPRPGTNEMVIPETLALNRNLGVGDVLGDPDRPAYPGAETLPAEFVVSGIFARSLAPEDENWWGFISLEFIESQEVFPLPDSLPLIVVPQAGQKDMLDDWLETELAGVGASVLTYRQELTRIRQSAQNQIVSIAMLQSIVAVVAAIGMAILNYIHISERQAEFGTLNAMGYNRRFLVKRVLGETTFTTIIAWSLGAIFTLIGMLYLRFGVFEPIGLSFNLFRLTPWLYTLPIPIAVLAVTTGTIAWTISKLDPISIVERRL